MVWYCFCQSHLIRGAGEQLLWRPVSQLLFCLFLTTNNKPQPPSRSRIRRAGPRLSGWRPTSLTPSSGWNLNFLFSGCAATTGRDVAAAAGEKTLVWFSRTLRPERPEIELQKVQSSPDQAEAERGAVSQVVGSERSELLRPRETVTTALTCFPFNLSITCAQTCPSLMRASRQEIQIWFMSKINFSRSHEQQSFKCHLVNLVSVSRSRSRSRSGARNSLNVASCDANTHTHRTVSWPGLEEQQ